ncbi:MULTISPECIES: glycosyltransferase [unclassified Pseudomonas]|jgi:spore maturation protein CgeB|uniref:CgeB family protein n=1 Tax=unclassified Pseudomonas TaxID=196821 RepID=UPI000DACC8EC|nr:MULTISPECIES: glycosyltransferase [unclassified Pseudomonas]PZW40897.1 spore maturation protein CgeB [Pseudomonas sp. URMO17WK12:I2]
MEQLPEGDTLAVGKRKYLILDGIGGVPLGRELFEAFLEAGVPAVHWDALRQKPRRWYGVASALYKASNKAGERDGFSHLPRLPLEPLRKLLEDEAPTHVLVVGFLYKHYDLDQVAVLVRDRGARFMLYDTDSCNLYSKRREFLYFIGQELPRYDLLFSFSEVTTRFFRETLGLNAQYLPFGAVDLPQQQREPERDVLFVGSADLRRVFLLENIREHLTVRGNRWRRNHALMSPELQERVDDRAVWGEELRELLQTSRIVLNITRSDFHGAETGVNLRIFEAISAGCFLLTDYCEEIASLFTPGEEIEVFRSRAELKDKVRHYLANPAECERVARNGRARFLEQHTWANRVAHILACA